MKRMVDDKEIRNFDDRITALEHGGSIDVYTKAESDAKFQTIEGMSAYAKLNDDTQTITASALTVTPGAGYIHTTYDASTIHMSIPRTPGYTLNIPTKNGTLATTDDIPTYTGGTGIDITNDVVSVNNNVAMKSDIPTYTDGTGIDITNNTISIDNTVALKTEIPTYTGGTGININSSNVVSIDNTVALKTDIPTYTGGSGISISGTTIAADNTLARVADIPSITGLTMYNYKITISGMDGGTATARSAVYIVSLPYQWDYSSLTKYDIIHRIPVWSVVVDTDTTAGYKNMGRFHWQTGTIAQVDWVDGTFTYFSFVDGFNATIEPAAPAHW